MKEYGLTFKQVFISFFVLLAVTGIFTEITFTYSSLAPYFVKIFCGGVAILAGFLTLGCFIGLIKQKYVD